jgi:hypothetical protein
MMAPFLSHTESTQHTSRRLASAPIHRSAWKGNSPKLVRMMPHSPSLWPPYGRPESSRLLKVNLCMLHLRIMMHSGGCAALLQNAEMREG